MSGQFTVEIGRSAAAAFAFASAGGGDDGNAMLSSAPTAHIVCTRVQAWWRSASGERAVEVHILTQCTEVFQD